MKENVHKEKPVPSPEEGKTLSINLADLYSFETSDLVLEISEEHYSNIAYMQVAPRDVYIDFLTMPGVKKDGKMVIEGTRIYMSHVAAQRLVESLGQLLKNVHQTGVMEIFAPANAKKIKSTTKVDLPVRETEA
jgi:Protein of unknown function (DUF3467).